MWRQRFLLCALSASVGSSPWDLRAGPSTCCFEAMALMLPARQSRYPLNAALPLSCKLIRIELCSKQIPHFTTNSLCTASCPRHDVGPGARVLEPGLRLRELHLDSECTTVIQVNRSVQALRRRRTLMACLLRLDIIVDLLGLPQIPFRSSLASLGCLQGCRPPFQTLACLLA